MDSSSWAHLPSVQQSIADLSNTISEQAPDATEDLHYATTTSQKVCIALRGLEERHRRGAQYLPNVDTLFRRMAGMMDILEKVLQDHISGESDSVVIWHGQESETVNSLTSVFEIFGKTTGLVILYSETLETRPTTSPTERMKSYCRIVEEVGKRRQEWRDRCKGNAFDPEPIDTLLDMIEKETKHHLMPAGFSPPIVPVPATAPTESDAPPAYETVVGGSKESKISDSKGNAPLEEMNSSAAGPSRLAPPQKNSSKNTGPTALNPQQIIAIPRRSRPNEIVQVSLTPDALRIVTWSVDSIAAYSPGTGELLWRIGSDHKSLSKKGVPCRFQDLKCFSPDGSLVVFIVEGGVTRAELVVIGVSDGRVLGSRTVIASQCLSVAISHSNRRVALACVSPKESEFGHVMLLAFDPNQPAGMGFTGRPLQMRQIEEQKPKPTVASCFTPDGSHLVVAAELLKPIPNSGQQTRTTHIRVFATRSGTKLVKHWEINKDKVVNQPPFNPEFVFPQDETSGNHKWLMAWNGDDALNPSTFNLGDIAHKEIYTTIREGYIGLSFRQILGTVTKTIVWAKVRFSSNGIWTHVVRKGKKKQAKICITRGRWDKDGFSWTGKDESKDNPAKILVIGADDDWQVSNDGRMGVTYNKEKERIELWSF